MNISKAAVVFCAAIFFSCAKQSPNTFSDTQLIRIADFQDKRFSDSLYQFLSEENPIYRRAAALALGSVQDTLASKVLGDILLSDSDRQARINAAFALGQTGGFAAVNSLIAGKEDSESVVVQVVLESLGKTLAATEINELTSYQPKDSIATIGLAWGFYRVGLRGIIDSTITERSIAYLDFSQPESVRLGAAHYFARSNAPFSKQEKIIISATSDPSVDVRMAAASALRKVDSIKAITTITKILDGENDYRVRSNAVRSLSVFSLKLTLSVLQKALSDENINVGITASEVIRSKSNRGAKFEISPEKYNDTRIMGNIYAAMLKAKSSVELSSQIIDQYNKHNQVYDRIHFLSALGDCGQESISKVSEWLIEQLLNGASPMVIKTSAASSLTRINNQPYFLKENSNVFAGMYKQAVLDGDAAVIGIICNALSNSKNGYKDVVTDIQFLKDARNNLNLPKDFEAIEPLDQAIAFFEGNPKPEHLKNEFNHPINWDLAKTISSKQLVKIKTSKGEIMIRLLVDESPGSVTNFIELINKGYYTNKFVHRVVPNFVIQAGCYRGDGYGSEDYSIRSEFGLRKYTQGAVGMASAGKDTEGTQWFITHSHTPHLDGRYTIFAVVEKGMEVVNLIQVGDTIQQVEMIK